MGVKKEKKRKAEKIGGHGVSATVSRGGGNLIMCLGEHPLAETDCWLVT